MKYFKLGVLAFIVSLAISQVGIKATGYVTSIDLTLPKSSKYYQSGFYHKDIDNYQYYKNSVTKTDGFPFHEIKVIAKTVSSNGTVSTGLVLDTGEQKTWGDRGYNLFVGDYAIRLQRGNTSIFTASHWGHWFLDERIAQA